MDLSNHLDLGILALNKPLNLMVLINVLISPVCTKSVMEVWWCSQCYMWMTSCSLVMMWGYYLQLRYGYLAILYERLGQSHSWD